MSIKLRALMGVSVVAAMAVAGAASATSIYGGGSTLIAPYFRQAADCYGNDLPLLTPPSGSTTVQTFTACASPYVSPTTNDVQYVGTGSGGGIGGVFSHDPTRYGLSPAWSNGVQFGLSETALLGTDVTIYNSGGTIQGATLTATPSGPNQYPLPKPLYGALVQFPVALAPVALAYDPVYKKIDAAGTVTSYRFNVNSSFARVNGGLRLDQATYCAIANGTITNWNDGALTALNGGVSLRDPADPVPQASWSVPIETVGRNESSGTTTVFTRHLFAACGGAIPSNNFQAANGSSTLPAGVQGPVFSGTPVTPVAGKFTRVNGSQGVAAYTSFTAVPATNATLVQGRLGYVGADYALPFAANNGLPYTLNTADLANSTGAFRAPTATNATAAFGANRPPQTTALSGAINIGATDWGLRINPEDWVRVASISNPNSSLANPTPATAYPIVGTVNFIGYTCYAGSAKASTLRSFSNSNTALLNYWLSTSDPVSGANGVLASAGLAPLPAIWLNAINKTFLQNTSDASFLNLYMDEAGSGASNSTCTSATGA